VQNPHFYVGLPKSWTGYGDSFSSKPTETYEGTIYVLTNNLVPASGDSRRVFFEFGGKTRAFDNFWDTNNTLIFKGGPYVPPLSFTDMFSDVTGRLEGETVVENSILANTEPAFWYRMIRMQPPPAEIRAPKPTRDWRVPIRELLGEKLSHTHVRIGGSRSDI